jgi:CubicO group peptidase (beta-lactamase class C family)
MIEPSLLNRRQFVWMVGTATVGLGLAPSLPWAGEDTALETFIRQELAESRLAGCAVAVVVGQRLVWSKAFGLADREKQISMTADTIQNIGSISKTVTATAVMQLWEQEKLALDADVNDYLDFSVRNPRHPSIPITVRQLLTHRSSITDGPSYERSYACGDPTISLEDWIKGYLTPKGPYYDGEKNFHLWEPGTEDPPKQPRAYTNVGYGLLGYLVEKLSETAFNDYTNQKIFSPLGMNATGWFLDEVDVSKHAVPYSWIPEGEIPDELLPRDGHDVPAEPGTLFPHCLYSFYNYPDGLVRTNVMDLSRFLMAYINGGKLGETRLLNQETVQLMLSKKHFRRGLCWSTTELENGDMIWGHGGGDPGISTYMGFRSDDGVGAIVFFTGRPGAAFRSILERLFEEAEKL